ncbi:MAG: ABC transporter ATP-binding protein [Treponema sp.]|jgi:oligopeptide/dipeptide ABC transporter ATP-binding protein|nr:ABC transporter ATP-binding protein [Treponema sp.]
MSNVLLQVEDLRKYFHAGGSASFLGGAHGRREVKAVDGVSFDIMAGERFALVGESGSGKSTIARCVLKLLNPTSGRVVFDGKTIFDSGADISLSHNGMMPLRRDMQVIFQNPDASLDPRMTAAEVVAEGILKHKIAPRREASKAAMDYLELCGLARSEAGKRTPEFSGGQKQRIGIARALALKPRLVVADEPLSALDVSVQAQILALMQDLSEQLSLTFLFISHDLRTVRFFCDRTGVLYLGTLVETGAAEEVMADPLHPYTRSLVSSIPRDRPGERRPRLKLEGEIPSAANSPLGCKFHPRCPHRAAICESVVPILEDAGGISKRSVACHLWRTLARVVTEGNAGVGI